MLPLCLGSHLNSQICTGHVSHARKEHAHHAFRYPLYMLWVDLDELEILNNIHWALGTQWRNLLRFKQSDYFPDGTGPLKNRALCAIKNLGISDTFEKVFVLCQGRCFGFYFSPVNFYFYQDQNDAIRYMVAEVSNTPWNERYHYLVPLDKNKVNHPKQFHVSPFMDLAMEYHWRVKTDDEQVKIVIDNYRENEQVFNASLHLYRNPLSAQVIKKTIRTFPAMTLSVVKGIYWHALQLFLKKVPFISHPGK